MSEDVDKLIDSLKNEDCDKRKKITDLLLASIQDDMDLKLIKALEQIVKHRDNK